MTRNVLISLLRQGSTGSEILRILDAIVLGDSDDKPGQRSSYVPTLTPIDF